MENHAAGVGILIPGNNSHAARHPLQIEQVYDSGTTIVLIEKLMEEEQIKTIKNAA